jgi:hypothetical protein
VDPDYVTGIVNGVDHGLRLRGELRIPVVDCMWCGATHTTSGGGEPELPENLVTFGGDAVTYEGDYVVYNA